MSIETIKDALPGWARDLKPNLSTVLSAITAVLGAVFGGLLAWAISVGPRDGLLRRLVLAGSGTLAQFGGVMLAFAFLATFGFNGLVTLFLHDRLAGTRLVNVP